MVLAFVIAEKKKLLGSGTIAFRNSKVIIFNESGYLNALRGQGHSSV